MNIENSTIVYFHTGRGGRFNNSGHKSFRGSKDIIEVLQLCDSGRHWNFINPENYYDIRKKLEKKDLTNLLKLFDDCTDKNDYSDFEKRTGLILGEDYYFDGNGVPLISVAEAETGLGRLDWDGDYDRDTCQYLSDCDESELILIAESNEWNKESLLQEYFDKNTDLKVDWSNFNGDYTGLIESYYFSNFDIEEYYEIEQAYENN